MAKESMREILAKEPKRKIKLPIDPLNPDNTTKLVAINGYAFSIQRGVEVEVPQSVYDILVRTGNY